MSDLPPTRDPACATRPRDGPDAGEIVVHILNHGRVLCRFDARQTMFWPPGHLWVGLDDPKPVTCARCLVVASAIDHKRRGAVCAYPECGGDCEECRHA